MIYFYRSININYYLLINILFLSFIGVAFSKCILEGHDITCFGGAWKEDLLPIENHSLERLFISRCAKLKPHAETIDLNFLKNVAKLSLLSMTHCELNTPPFVHYQINSIETIDLSYNQIDANAQFLIVNLNIFKQFPNLKVLNLTNNVLTHLPKSWFWCPSQLEIIILDGNLIRGLSPSLADCFIRLKQLSLKHNQFQRLRMPSDTMKLSHSGYLKEANGLKLFAEQNNMIHKLKYGNKRFPRNQDFTRDRHDFNDVIPQFKSLEFLDFSHNKIHSIDQIPLSNLENLLRLNLTHNLLSNTKSSGNNENECDFGTAPFYIKGKSGLVELDLSFNQGLTRIHNCWTFGLQNLRTLKMKNCSVTFIYASSFEKMKSLTVLDLSHNNLSSVPKEITAVSKTLTWLSLAGNNISQMKSSYINSLENLRFLNISNNKYQTLVSLSEHEIDSRLTESIEDIKSISSISNSGEVINLLSQMRHLQEIDLSYNNLVKISALYDLSPSMKHNGRLQRIDLRGNSFIKQFLDFKVDEITTTLTEFLINEDLNLNCDCLIIGFIKWVIERQIEIFQRCSSPTQLSGMSLSNLNLLKVILDNKVCDRNSISKNIKTTYTLKILSNANISQDLLNSNNDPINNSQAKLGNHKKVDYQKWVIAGYNLTLRCDFLSKYPIDFPINIEWQRIKMNPIDNTQDTHDSLKNKNIFLKNIKPNLLGHVKYREKIEYMSSSYDSRIQITQIGPVNKDMVVDYSIYPEEFKNIPLKRNDANYKYVSFLILQPVLFNDIGRYRCFINGLTTINTYGQKQLISKEEDIKVFTPPRFTSTPTNPMAIIEGETAEISCRAVGNPLPTTSLGRIGSKDFPAARGRRMTMYKDDSSFFITNVRQIDAGNYSCISRNIAGIIFHNFTLKVQIPAVILNKLQSNRTVKIGDVLIIGFKIDGIPLPAINWYKDGEKIVENDRIRFSSDHLMLIIQSSIFMDAGIYKISVLNALGGNDAYVYVNIIKNERRPILGFATSVKEKSLVTNHGKDQTWMSDYWLSGIIIIVILSIILTSILWITIFFCFTKIINSKKRRLQSLSNSQFRNNFNRDINSSKSEFSNLQLISSSVFKPLNKSSIPLSLTTSTLVPYDQSTIDIDCFNDYTGNSSGISSPQLFHNFLPFSNNHLLSQQYFSSSTLEKFNKSIIPSIKTESRYRFTDTCDSGIDSSQIYSETHQASDIPLSMYQCKPKSKHRSNHQKLKKRELCSDIYNKIESVDLKKSDFKKVIDVQDQLHLKMCSCQEGESGKKCTIALIMDHLHHSPLC